MLHETVIEWEDIYGSIFTFWLGNKPVIILANIESITEAYKLKKNHFDRDKMQLEEILLHTPTSVDIIASKLSMEWEYLRKITHKASKKFAMSDSLPNIAIPIVDQIIENMKHESKRCENYSFVPQDELSKLVYCILASFLTGESASMSDKTITNIMKSFLIQVGVADKLLLIEFMPSLRKTIFRNDWNRLTSGYRYVSNWCYNKVTDHMNKYSNIEGDDVDGTTTIKSFIDELIKQKKTGDAKYDNYIDKVNMTNVAMNLFIAGSNSTTITLSWALLFMCKYLDIQAKLRSDIYSNIAEDAMITSGDMVKCSYVQAFITEVLRMCPVLPLSLPHVTTCDTNISGKHIPKDTTIIPSLIHASYDPKLWKDPKIFRPERFIDSQTGKYVKSNPGFIPFGIGKRMCIGEKMAYSNIFVIIARILQKTKGYMFAVNNPETIDPSPDPKYFEYKPKNFKVRLKTDCTFSAFYFNETDTNI